MFLLHWWLAVSFISVDRVLVIPNTYQYMLDGQGEINAH